VVGVLVFGLAIAIVYGALFVGVDVDSEVGGCAGFAFEAANFGVEIFWLE